jgi:hypothetical protein
MNAFVLIIILVLLVIGYIIYRVISFGYKLFEGPLGFLTGSTKPRPVGPLNSCKPDQEKNGALCYPKCKENYKGVGPVCWERCPEGYRDDGAFCAKDSYGRGVGKIPSTCPAGQVKKGALCYEECPTGYHWFGLDCVKNCPSDYKDTGHHCTKPSYGRGAGRIPDKWPCNHWDAKDPKTGQLVPNKWRDDGTSCWSDAHIFGRMRSAGWNGKCRPGEKKKCAGICGHSFVSCYKDCPAGYHNDGLTCRKTGVGIKKNLFQRQHCRDDEEKIGALCYKKCKENYKGVGPVCWGRCPGGMTDIGVGCQKNGLINRSMHPKAPQCHTDEEKQAGLCYKHCKDGYKGVGPVCWRRCPQGMKDIGVSCAKHSYGRGAGHPLICGAEKPDKIGALCYGACSEGYKAKNITCVKDDGWGLGKLKDKILGKSDKK